MKTRNITTLQHLTMTGVIGSGSFGTAIANLIATNEQVLLYSRNAELVEKINKSRRHQGVDLHDNVLAVNSLQEVAERCSLIFPIVPSGSFRSMMKDLSPYLHPYHLLIHGTKGFDIREPNAGEKTGRRHIRTMSEVIKEESVVVRIGCLSGPNLAKEIMAGQPTATVIASHFQEVVERGKNSLNSRRFQVFGSAELLGAELAGALKNTIALGSGILGGLGMGKNIQALLITRGLNEMISFGKAMGATPRAFVGTAGIGDLICTATSEDSRNFTFGKRMGSGETIEEIKESMPELAEGLRTLKIAKELADFYKLHVPITQMLYRVMYEDLKIETAIEFLMRYPYDIDVDFL